MKKEEKLISNAFSYQKPIPQGIPFKNLKFKTERKNFNKPKINITKKEYAFETVLLTSIIVALKIDFGVIKRSWKLGMKVTNKLIREAIKGMFITDLRISLNVFALYLGFFSTILIKFLLQGIKDANNLLIISSVSISK